MGVSQTVCPDWPQTMILPISACQISKITGVSHWPPGQDLIILVAKLSLKINLDCVRYGNSLTIKKYLIFRGPLLAVSIEFSFVISFVHFLLIPICKTNATAAKNSIQIIFNYV
jgi:hypothetical protein